MLTLCARCHGMVHIRHKIPNRWERYKHICRWQTYEGPVPKNMGEFFARSKGVYDIPFFQAKPTGNAAIDNIPKVSYKGPPKIATAIVSGEEIPDTKIYGKGWGLLSGVLIRNGITTEVTFKE